jgi:putative peptidoglycan lipid II flippase
MDRPTRKVLGQFVPMVAGAFLFGGTELIDQAMAAMLDPGAVSALSYGHKVVMFILVVAAGALGTAVFPHFSRMVALLEWNAIAHTLRTYAVLILVASIPITLLCYVYSEQLVRIIYERGAFLNADTRRVAAVQAMYCLQTGFYLVNILLVRLISAMKGNRILMFSAFISLPLNVVLNYILMWRMREAGIALSTSIVSAASLVFLSAMACRMLKNARRGG